MHVSCNKTAPGGCLWLATIARLLAADMHAAFDARASRTLLRTALPETMPHRNRRANDSVIAPGHGGRPRPQPEIPT